jgi:hypothetical protein
MPYRAWRPLPIWWQPREPKPSLKAMLSYRLNRIECAVMYRIPRSHSLRQMSEWPLVQWRHLSD